METATSLLSKNDTTIVGVLLFFVVLLMIALRVIWKAYQEEVTYIKEQDKANLEMMMKITSTVGNVSEQADKIDDKVDTIKETTSSILGIIKERLQKNK